ncbi:universal stress protein [Nitrosopumilus sp. S6]
MTDFKHILVPFDGSSNGHNSIETASKIAANHGGKLTILQLIEKKIPRFFFFKTKTDKLNEANEINTAQKNAENFRNIAKKHGANVAIKIKEIDIDPHEHIIEFANKSDVDLVVMNPSKNINTTEIHESIVDKISKNIDCSILRLQ